MNFADFAFHPKVLSAVEQSGYTTPTPIQASAIPIVLSGRDAVGLAQTGTGKTAAFVLPILNRLIQSGHSRLPRALIVAPTRELADQIHQVTVAFAKGSGLKSMVIFGGVGMRPQVEGLRNGVDIIVACPGRLLDHMQERTVDLTKIEVLVLDEADHMFDMGFLPNIRKIVRGLPKNRQTLLFSATMPDEIRHLANEVLNNAETIQVDRIRPAATVAHALYPVHQDQKTGLLLHLLGSVERDSVLIFTRTKHRAKRLAEQLSKLDFKVAALQGNLSQARRTDAIGGFRDGRYQILVATDIAARGIDIASVSHVINYDIPDTVEAYTHRIGRTGRAARTGDAFTFITDEDGQMVRAIEKTLGTRIERKSLDGFKPIAGTADKEMFSRPPRPPQNRRQGGGRSGGQGGGQGGGGRPSNAGQSRGGERRDERRDSSGGRGPSSGGPSSAPRGSQGGSGSRGPSGGGPGQRSSRPAGQSNGGQRVAQQSGNRRAPERSVRG